MLVLFPLHNRSKYQEYASYVNTNKRNRIHISIRTQRMKLKEGNVSRSTIICWREVQNKEQNLLDESSKDTLLSKANNKDIWKWHVNNFCGYLALNTLSLSFTIYKQQGKVKKCYAKKKKRILKNILLLSFGVNVNVLKRSSLQTLWNMLQPLKHWRRVILRNDFWTSYWEW